MVVAVGVTLLVGVTEDVGVGVAVDVAAGVLVLVGVVVGVLVGVGVGALADRLKYCKQGLAITGPDIDISGDSASKTIAYSPASTVSNAVETLDAPIV